MKTPAQHTNADGYVLLVKCVNRDGTSHNGFVWPKAGPVKNEKWSRNADCDSGGLFGWPWGFAITDGREADACAPWLVFRAKPENVIDLSGKAKAVPSEDGKELPEVVYYGNQAGAMAFTMQGRVKYIQESSSGSASATGYSGSASATGDSGSASATGDSGSASATGYRGSASAETDGGCANSVGLYARAKGAVGTWLTLAEWKQIDDQWRRIDVRTNKVDGKKIKADTWYQLLRGKFVEVKE